MKAIRTWDDNDDDNNNNNNNLDDESDGIFIVRGQHEGNSGVGQQQHY